MSVSLRELIERAAAEGWRIQPPTLEARPITLPDGTAVGFYCPHPAGRGRTRVGPIYVVPEHRGQGLALQAYAWAEASTPLVAFVHDTNHASARLHERAGFRRWYHTKSGWYWRRG